MAQYSVTLKKRDFDGSLWLIQGAVSNGKWAIRTSAIKNSALFETREMAAAFLGDSGAVYETSNETTFERIDPGPSSRVHAWNSTKFLFDGGAVTGRIFQSTKTGEMMSIDRKFLEIFKEDNARVTLHGSTPDSPFMLGETVEAAVAIFMPLRLDPLPVVPTKKKERS